MPDGPQKEAAPHGCAAPLEPEAGAGGVASGGPPQPSHRRSARDKSQQRAYSVTKSLKELRRDVKHGESPDARMVAEINRLRPRTRGDCERCQTCEQYIAAGGARDMRTLPCGHLAETAFRHCRPCPFVSCRFNLYLDVMPLSGSIKLNFPEEEPHVLQHSCALDLADDGGMTLESIGQVVNLTRERVRQVEEKAVRKVRRGRDLDDF